MKRNIFKLTLSRFLEQIIYTISIPLQIVVVPDSTAAQKVPAVPGLLEYRKDTKKLYVRSNETWNAIGGQNKVTLTLHK